MNAEATKVSDLAGRAGHAYAGDENRPLGSFLVLMATYGAAVTGASALVRASGRRLPERIAWPDLALVAVATHRLSRLLAKDPVTSPLRAPFTRFSGTSGPSELSEEVRGSGPRKAVGELVTCPFCMSQWIATAFAFGLVLAPRAARFATGVLAAVSGADFLQLAYARAESAG